MNEQSAFVTQFQGQRRKMANKAWMAGAVRHPGVFRAAAQRAGMSTHAFAEKHKGDKGKIGKRARLALTFEKARKK